MLPLKSLIIHKVNNTFLFFDMGQRKKSEWKFKKYT